MNMMREPHSDDYKHAHSILDVMFYISEDCLRSAKAVYDDPELLKDQERLTKHIELFQQKVAERI
jgi:hypothetical protein